MFTKNSRLSSCHFDRKKINTDSYMSGDPVYFAWNNWRKLLMQGKMERYKSAKPWMSVSSAPLHITFHRVPLWQGSLYGLIMEHLIIFRNYYFAQTTLAFSRQKLRTSCIPGQHEIPDNCISLYSTMSHIRNKLRLTNRHSLVCTAEKKTSTKKKKKVMRKQ